MRYIFALRTGRDLDVAPTTATDVELRLTHRAWLADPARKRTPKTQVVGLVASIKPPIVR